VKRLTFPETSVLPAKKFTVIQSEVSITEVWGADADDAVRRLTQGEGLTIGWQEPKILEVRED
jgi:hypothetical protein